MQYTVVKSKRKTLSMSVNKQGELVVRAPLFVRDAEIEEFVGRHRAWAEKQLALHVPLPKFQNGDVIELEGRRYTIADGARAALRGDMLLLPKTKRAEAFIALLKKMASVRMKRLLDELCARSRLSYEKLTITSARSRWGSCSNRKHICFSFRTAFLPDSLAIYLAVHELCHTRHMNHSAKFWKAVEGFLPDYSERRNALKRYQWAMRCL